MLANAVAVALLQPRGAYARRSADGAVRSGQRCSRDAATTGGLRPPLLAVAAFVHRKSRFFTVERTTCSKSGGCEPAVLHGTAPATALPQLFRRPPTACCRTALQLRCCNHGGLTHGVLLTMRCGVVSVAVATLQPRGVYAPRFWLYLRSCIAKSRVPLRVRCPIATGGLRLPLLILHERLRFRFRSGCIAEPRGLTLARAVQHRRLPVKLPLFRYTNAHTGAAGVSPPCFTEPHLQWHFRNCSGDRRRCVGERRCTCDAATTGGLRLPLLILHERVQFLFTISVPGASPEPRRTNPGRYGECSLSLEKSRFPCATVWRTPVSGRAPLAYPNGQEVCIVTALWLCAWDSYAKRREQL